MQRNEFLLAFTITIVVIGGILGWVLVGYGNPYLGMGMFVFIIIVSLILYLSSKEED